MGQSGNPPSTPDLFIALIAEFRQIKTVKTLVESHHEKLDGSRVRQISQIRICDWFKFQNQFRPAWTILPHLKPELAAIPTAIPVSTPDGHEDDFADTLLDDAVLRLTIPPEIASRITGLAAYHPAASISRLDKTKPGPAARTMDSFLSRLTDDDLDRIRNRITTATHTHQSPSAREWVRENVRFPRTFVFYSPLLFFPTGAFSTVEWTAVFDHLPAEQHRRLFADIAAHFGVTHVAIQGPIPASPTIHTAGGTESDLAILQRLPTEITSLHGSLGPAEAHSVVVPVSSRYSSSTTTTTAPVSLPDLTHPASTSIVKDTLFVTVRQFGLDFVFAPLRSMFSRGNVHERERLLSVLSHPSPDTATGPGPTTAGLACPIIECSAIDLFAGIGYFSFCYAASAPRSGVRLVATWEINGWSVEAMYRGVVSNGWAGNVICLADSDSDSVLDPTSQQSTHENYRCSRSHTPVKTKRQPGSSPIFRIHHGPHQTASAIIRAARSKWPPIRHVNLGYLPHSSVDGAWVTAVDAIDPFYGGWIRVHENVRKDKISATADEIKTHFASLLAAREKGHREGVQIVDTTVVKSYAPRVFHCVFDVWIPGAQQVETDR